MTTVEYIFALILAANTIRIVVTHARRLQEIDRKLSSIVAHLGIQPLASATPSSRVVGLATDSTQRIAAIKAYREESGAGLKEAVAVIDRIAADSAATRTEKSRSLQ